MNGSFRVLGVILLASCGWDVARGDTESPLRATVGGSLATDRDHVRQFAFDGDDATYYESADPAAADPVERVSCRPDAALPCYGTFNRSAFTGGGLAYNREVQKTAAATDPSLIVHAGCPPYFIWQCAGQDDPRGALSLADRLAALGIPFELHIFPYGNHGLGLADAFGPNPTGNPHVALWVDCCVHWLREEGFGA